MKVIQNGNNFTIFPHADAILDRLVPSHYTVEFNPFTGYSLASASPFTPPNHKTYGGIDSKVERLFKRHAFKQAQDNSNTGVICSGKKGSGKSLLIRISAIKAIALGMPVISIDSYSPALPKFIASIDQPCLFLLDEFEKTFDETDQQNELLTVLDGTTDKNGHLFLFAVNDRHKVSEYLFNRPGRTHYHFKYGYLSEPIIREYLEDTIEDKTRIDDALDLCKQIDCTFDILQALAYEVNQGYSVNEIKEALNADIKSEFTAVTTMRDGSTVSQYNDSDMSSGGSFRIVIPPMKWVNSDGDKRERNNNIYFFINKEYATVNENTGDTEIVFDEENKDLFEHVVCELNHELADQIFKQVSKVHIEYGFRYISRAVF